MSRASTSASVVAFCTFAMVTYGCEEKKADAPAPVASAASAASAAPPIIAAPSAASSTSTSTSTTGSAPAAVPDAIAAQHVLVAYKGAEKAPKGVTRSKVDARKRAEEVAARAKSGVDFSALVAEYSDDPAAKERQGSVGKFTRDKMAKPFSDAAFALAVGEVSGAVETPFGFHVIKRNQ